MYILNGIHSQAAYTCHTSRGDSIVDYMLCNKQFPQVKHTNIQAYKISDHDLLETVIPITSAGHTQQTDETIPPETESTNGQSSRLSAEERASHPRKTTSAEDRRKIVKEKTYKWREGACLKEYGNSAATWKNHTSSPAFKAAFETVAAQFSNDNEVRSKKIEEFLLNEATVAGVVNVSEKRTAKNPNKWAKHFAPWFDTLCYTARTRYREAVKRNGKEHQHTKEMFKKYV